MRLDHSSLQKFISPQTRTFEAKHASSIVAGPSKETITTRLTVGHIDLPEDQEQLRVAFGTGIVVHGGNSSVIKSALESVEEEDRNPLSVSFAIKRHLVKSLLLRAFYSETVWLEESVLTRKLRFEKGIALALQTMRRNPEEHWTVASLAAVALMSRSVFAERFEELLGRPPLQYLRKIRLAKAHTALASGMNSEQAAALAGYTSERAFSTSFSRQYGNTPRQIRRGDSQPI